MKHIFISYSHKDVEWKNKLVSHLSILEREELCQLWHDHVIGLGEEWHPEIDAALNRAHIAIMLISNNFLESDFINKQEIPRLRERREKHGLILVPLFLRHCAWQEVQWLNSLQGYPGDDCPVVKTEGVNAQVDEKLAEFARLISQMIKGNKRTFTIPDSSPDKQTKKTILLTALPHRKIDLIGREDELQFIEQQLQDTGPVLLVQGLGGIGKTEVCKRFFMDNYCRFSFAGWIDCISSIRESMINAFADFPQQFNITANDDLEERFRKITVFLRQLGRDALLVFDNIETPDDDYLDLLTTLPCTLLANSRSVLPGFKPYSLDFLSEPGCMELFYRYYDIEREEETVKDIVALCGRHTLTVELLARTAGKATLKTEELYDLLVQKGFNLDEAIHDTVHTSWHNEKQRRTIFNHLLAIFDLSGVTSQEQEILVNLAVLPPVYIPLRDIKEWLGLENNEAVNALVEKGWLRRDKGKIFLHQMVAEVIRFKQKPDLKTCEHVILSLSDKLSVEPGENPLSKKGWVIFGETVLYHIDEIHQQVATLANNLSLMYQDLGLTTKALEFQLKDIEISEKTLDSNHPDLASSYNNVSTIYKALGQLQQALEFQKKALKIRKEVLDSIHPSLATSYNNVSTIYKDLGQLEKALEFQKKALKIREEVLDSNHPSLATSYNNISTIYKDLGQLEKALEFQLKTVTIFEEVLDSNHPSLATAYNNVSMIYKDLGQLEKALEFQLKAVNILEETLDNNHPSLATAYNNISTIYKDLGQLEKALEFQLKDIEISEKTLDSNHPSLATSYNNLSQIYQDLGQLEKALEFQKKALKIREEVLGKNHPSLATSYNNVSTIYKALGQLQQALEFQKKALKIRKEVLDSIHPSLATSYNNVSTIYKDLGQLEQALPYSEKAVAILRQLFPNGHPDLTIMKGNLEIIKQAMKER